jgi:uncharacterized damage-inducible protein DinB
MNLLEHFRRQFDHDFWANSEVLRALEASGGPVSSIQVLAHMVAAERLWLDRLQNQPTHLAVWPDLSLTQCGAELHDAQAAWDSYLTALKDAELSEICSYTNSKGEVWKNTVADILSHVVLHSSYHRGQIALDLRRSGGVPAYTDYIHAARKGLLE